MIQKVAADIDTVSFDIFDTLVHRAVAVPSDVFLAVTLKLATHPLALKYHDIFLNFPASRKAAEADARYRRAVEHGGEGEITFDEIYMQYATCEKVCQGVTSLLRETELEVENAICYRSRIGYELYLEAIALNKNIIFVSDMYLPKEFICKLLNEFGYNRANMDTIFISGDLRVSKNSGAIYLKIAEDLKIVPKRWLHIGDNKHADILMAHKCGLKAMHAHWGTVNNTKTPRVHIQDCFVASLMTGLRLPQHSVELGSESALFKLGYNYFGPAIFGYYIWLLNEIKLYGADKVLFFARDAQILLRLHERMVEIGAINVSWSHEYVFISRKAALPLGIVDFPLNKIDFWVPKKARRKLKDLIASFGVDPRTIVADIERAGFNLDTQVGSDDFHKVHTLINRLSADILRASVKECAMFSDYYINSIRNAKKLAIIDIGWNCNVQSSFVRALAKRDFKPEIHGFYFGLFDSAVINISRDVRAKGWTTHLGEPSHRQKSFWQGGVELLEFACTAHHGSTLGYRRDQNGVIVPVLEEKGDEEAAYEKSAIQVQRGIIAFAERFAFLLRVIPTMSLQSPEWSVPFFELVDNPTREQADLLGPLTHSDSFGENIKRLTLAPQLSVLDRLLKGKAYRRELESAFWKPGFKARNQRQWW